MMTDYPVKYKGAVLKAGNRVSRAKLSDNKSSQVWDAITLALSVPKSLHKVNTLIVLFPTFGKYQIDILKIAGRQSKNI